LVAGGADGAAQRQLPGRVVAAPAVMRPRRARPHDEDEGGDRDRVARASHAFLRSSARIGRLRTRLPVRRKSALQTAGATVGTPGSPRPPGASLESTMCVSTTG